MCALEAMDSRLYCELGIRNCFSTVSQSQSAGSSSNLERLETNCASGTIVADDILAADLEEPSISL